MTGGACHAVACVARLEINLIMETTMSEALGNTEGGLALKSDRRFLLKSSLATLGALSATTFAGTASAAAPLTDVNILNFALNLEYLEAEYYVRATTGMGLTAADTTGGNGQAAGTVKGGTAVTFNNQLYRQIAKEIADDELHHVQFLRAALGSAAVAEPDINFTDTFNALAMAAGLGSTFDPFASETNFLIGAYVFEDVGVTAYNGAAPAISNKTYLGAAASILSVEAYHAGCIRTLLLQAGQQHAANAISGVRDSLDGNPHNQDQGIVVGGKDNVVPTDMNGLAFTRTPSEVLGIVYAGGQSGNYGFFPNKVNGAIQ